MFNIIQLNLIQLFVHKVYLLLQHKIFLGIFVMFLCRWSVADYKDAIINKT